MSDLNYLFRQSKIKESPPSRKLFPERRSRPRSKSQDKYKSQTSNQSTQHFPVEQLYKRSLPKHNLKKQLKFYNHQTVLALLRKIFISMVTTLTLNLIATHIDQTIVIANLALVTTLLNPHLGFDLLGSLKFRMLHLFAKTAIYCLNFYLVLAFILNKDHQHLHPAAALIISLNAGINYLLLNFTEPIITLRVGLNNRSPYTTIFQTISEEVRTFFSSFRTIYHLGRPILCLNLAYWLSVVLFIIKKQDNALFEQIFSKSAIRVMVASSLLLHIFVYIVKFIDRKISIELLSPNKKQINLNLLKLDDQNRNNSDIHLQLQKYIWNNSENFWDTEFLSHRYNINYDLLETHILKSMAKLERQARQTKITLEQNRNNRKQNEDEIEQNKFSLSQKLQEAKEIITVLELVFALENKIYMLFNLEQIFYFQQMGTSPPFAIDNIAKAIHKTTRTLAELQPIISVFQLRLCINSLNHYLTSILERQP